MKLGIRRALFFLAILGLIATVAIHALAIFGVNVQDFPVSPFVLHAPALFTFAGGVIWYFLDYQRIPLEERERGARYLLNKKPKVLLVFTLLSGFYAGANFLYFMGNTGGGGPEILGEKFVLQNHGTILREINREEYTRFRRNEIRGFSGIWLAFFLSGIALTYPLRKRTESTTDSLQAQPLRVPDSFSVPPSRVFDRVFEDRRWIFMVGWLLLLILGFGALGFFQGIFFVPSLLFTFALAGNLLFRLSQIKDLITRVSITQESLTGERYHYNTVIPFAIPLTELKTELKETYLRGNSIFRLHVRQKGREIFSQSSSKYWTYKELKQLQDRITTAQTPESPSAS